MVSCTLILMSPWNAVLQLHFEGHDVELDDMDLFVLGTTLFWYMPFFATSHSLTLFVL